ncbi:thioredoxin family protein [Candidatus Peregrinibacteria bacterium]|nr:thioredoxin family protein [Candidatus Peregrinibacteria bacterium]MBI3816005.1 thioredoxin family protein [Candidatus Peregrinibacteria bacterium]
MLYFFAAWCPICHQTNQTLTSWYTHGDGLLTIYRINYDTEKSLEQKYGVTYQHTFVKVDGKGNLITILTGPSDEELRDLLKA